MLISIFTALLHSFPFLAEKTLDTASSPKKVDVLLNTSLKRHPECFIVIEIKGWKALKCGATAFTHYRLAWHEFRHWQMTQLVRWFFFPSRLLVKYGITRKNLKKIRKRWKNSGRVRSGDKSKQTTNQNQKMQNTLLKIWSVLLLINLVTGSNHHHQKAVLTGTIAAMVDLQPSGLEGGSDSSIFIQVWRCNFLTFGFKEALMSNLKVVQYFWV